MNTLSIPVDPTHRASAETSSDWQEIVERQVGALKFGSVHITVHEGRVVQVETSVRIRFDKPSPGAA